MTRIPLTPPVIKPISQNISRPLWSVMIPAYNCSEYLKIALQSVLDQDPGKEIMQIEVIDDCSTDLNVEALVNSLGQNRVGYFRQPCNVGSLRNFETCLNRATGERVHLLHGDDLIKPGFYREINSLFDQYPDAGAAFTNHYSLNEDGREMALMKKLQNQSGLLENWPERIAIMNFIQPPSIVVKRAVYEHLGGFFGARFGEDWEMWNRIAQYYKFAYSPLRLASYRTHIDNITTQTSITGENIIDISYFIDVIQNYIPVDQRDKLKYLAKRNFSHYFAFRAHELYGNSPIKKAAFSLAKSALDMQLNRHTIYLFFKLCLKHIVNWKFWKMQ